jgi:hypothetical protein
MSIDDHAKLEAVEREIRLRRKVYPRLIAEGKMREASADFQIMVMVAIAEDYRKKVQPSLWDPKDEPA